MNIAILSCGAVVIKEAKNEWLFGAPENIKQSLQTAGIDVPDYVFTTSLRAPGFARLGKPVVRFKEAPFKMNGLHAYPITSKHGTDYVVRSPNGSILFSERGDVSVRETEDYDLAIIKNKHTSQDYGEHVIHWPWPDAEYKLQSGKVIPLEIDIKTKVWSSLDEVPSNIKSINGVPLSLDQVNFVARVAKSSADGADENWAVGIAAFKKAYKKQGDSWVKQSAEKNEQQMKTYDKLSQEKAKYVPEAGTDAGIQVCANCKYYYKNMTCTKVEGDIEPGGYCVLWEYPDMDHKKNGHAMEYSYMEDDAEQQEQEKELPPTEGEGVKKFGDVITAALHKAYNDTSDHYFSEGHLSQEERLEVAGAIGKALKVLRTNLPESLMVRDVTHAMPVPSALKEYGPVPDMLHDDTWFDVYKGSDGEDRWISVSSAAAWDRQQEFFSTKAMDWAIKFSELIGDKGPLRFKHIPGLDGGICDTQVRIGDFLLESGTFQNTPIGLAMKSVLQKSPEDWQMSVGLAYAKHDIVDGYYKRAAIFERSMTKKPALPVTTITLKENDKEFAMKIPTEQELKDAAEELGMELSEVKTLYERALQNGSGPLSLKEFQEVALKTSGMGGAAATHRKKRDEDDEEGEEYKSLEDIIYTLDEADFKELVDVVESAKQDMMEEDVDEDDEYPDRKMKGKKRQYKAGDERLDRLEDVVVQQSDMIMEQTKALSSLASAMAGAGQSNDLNGAVQEFMSGLPRRSANSFVSRTQTKEQQSAPGDDQVVERLKAIEQHLQQVQPAGTDIYNLFTSSKLNRSNRGGVQ